MSSVAPERGAARSAAWSWTTIASDGGERGNHRGRSGGGTAPTRFEPMNSPAAGVGTMITCTLSESLSASVFWMRSG